MKVILNEYYVPKDGKWIAGFINQKFEVTDKDDEFYYVIENGAINTNKIIPKKNCSIVETNAQKSMEDND